jgi:microcystin-dependent protein
MNIKDIILFTLILLTIYLLYKTTKLEKFNSNIDLTKEVNDIYKIDIDALRNMASLSKYLYINKEKCIIPINTAQVNNLNINGNLNVNGDVEFNYKNTNIFEIFPRYMIIAWFNEDIPKGWVICDGKKYLDANGIEIEIPDLRSYMIIGAFKGKSNNLTIRNYKTKGGDNTVLLEQIHLPQHTHKKPGAFGNSPNLDIKANLFTQINSISRNEEIVLLKGGAITITDSISSVNKLNTSLNYLSPRLGDNFLKFTAAEWETQQAHNNLPPCIAIYYIMKL